MALDTSALVSGIYGIGGMLIGGFIVYHRVEGLVQELRMEIKRVEDEQKDEFKQVWNKFETVQSTKVCETEKKGCQTQFNFFKDTHAEIRDLFKELRNDMKAELKLLRECISEITQKRC